MAQQRFSRCPARSDPIYVFNVFSYQFHVNLYKFGVLCFVLQSFRTFLNMFGSVDNISKNSNHNDDKNQFINNSNEDNSSTTLPCEQICRHSEGIFASSGWVLPRRFHALGFGTLHSGFL